ncbi:polyprenol monophosphomannose synthase [Sporomusa acidovorans]|uniref:Polyprenol monophosphomannose synthase n=1 Tax=Sporomusa acidovorans (strain ATCC 49682 / DSM 3132 / Mol) TaxID=1123286 RepID=A0ABZ3IZ95_SPOA4|nr:polyprenol monophosphomannose synthase [Sporomusa acidovorans]OZC19156.1 undecaprenyl-phosphate mannosyltransferase [Sporomusa acidovorans DSM 3132]SDF12146.1 dolichol-phosphate mannosyltransferase [Sporomusa acidovorans]
MKLVIIPTYNERNNIGQLLDLIYHYVPGIHVLVVDDGSPDGTGGFIESLMAGEHQGRLFMIKRTGKLGLGTAYIAGFKWALARQYEFIFEMDADFSHNPKYLPQFLKVITGCDVVLGSRYVAGGGVTNWSLIRRFISLGGSLYSRLILNLPFHDLTGGFKCFRREVLETINLDDVKSNGYSFQIEMTYRAFLLGFAIKEVPIIFEERAEGQSKMSSSIFREAIWMVPKLRAVKQNMKAVSTKPV